MFYRSRWIWVFAVFGLACSGSSPDSAGGGVTVFAAASTMEAMGRALESFEESTGIEVVASYASSATLARQIEAGADAGIFLCAHADWVGYLEARNLIARRCDYLSNSLVLVVPSDGDVAVAALDDLASPAVERIAIGDPESVPAGMYAAEALVRSGLWERVHSKIVPSTDVRLALLYVERGEAEAGIVYATDARITERVRVVASLDDNDSHEPSTRASCWFVTVIIVCRIHGRTVSSIIESRPSC